jgi:hypothetical protein
VRKLILAALPCLVLGLAAPAFAATAAHDRGTTQQGGGVGTDATTVGSTTTVAGGKAEARLSDRERVDRCSLDAILASDCLQQN